MESNIAQDSSEKGKGVYFGSLLDPGNFLEHSLCTCDKNDIDYRSERDHVPSLKQHCLGLCIKVNWMELPVELIYLIAHNFVHIRDLIRFGAVFTVWRSIYLQNCHSLPRQPPLLLLPTKQNQNNQMRSVYNLYEKSIWSLQLRVPQDSFCQGSCFGWLLMVTPSFQVSLLNPFLSHNNEIQLPPLTAFERDEDEVVHIRYIAKAVLSANPTYDPNYTVFVIHGGRLHLAFLKPGDKKWTNLNFKYQLIFDILPHGDQFYAVNHTGRVYAIDLHRPRPKVSMISPRPDGSMLHSECKYLVECCGDLLLIHRFRGYGREPRVTTHYFTGGFKVLKLDRECRKWVEMKSLGNNILFLGDNSSFSISASHFPECKPNSIYFTDDYDLGYYRRYYQNCASERGAHDMGVFSLEDGSIEPHYPMSEDDIIPPPVWIELPL
ncbi:hypothetical protein ACHQM5_008191 [Ranunculus cassubicifolius]